MTNRKHMIAIVDDDAGLRRTLRRMLESSAVQVETFCSAGEFLTYRDAGRVDCAVVDVEMPGVSGLSLLEQMRKDGIDVPVIIMSGRADVSLAVKAIKAGAADFIEKPFHRSTLLNSIRHVVLQDSAGQMQWPQHAAGSAAIRKWELAQDSEISKPFLMEEEQ